MDGLVGDTVEGMELGVIVGSIEMVGDAVGEKVGSTVGATE